MGRRESSATPEIRAVLPRDAAARTTPNFAGSPRLRLGAAASLSTPLEMRIRRMGRRPNR